MQFEIPYGKQNITLQLPDNLQVDWITPQEATPAENPHELVKSIIHANEVFQSWVQTNNVQSVAIAINDKTRPIPHDVLLPPLLESLEQQGIQPENIHFFIASGTHPLMPLSEYSWILSPDIIERYPITCHQCDDVENIIEVGKTQRGTPVTIHKDYARADLKIVVGNIEPHQFMGFSGGVKSAVIGLARRDTINANHSLMMNPKAKSAQFATNPMRQDVEEMGRIVGIQFALNTIMNRDKKIVDIFFGEPTQVMEQAVPKVQQVYQTPVSQQYDLVIVSPGGHPKDINVYQAQKALTHASWVNRDDGIVILLAACPEGTGSEKYEDWVKDRHSHDEVFEDFAADGFRIGPHKAFQISRDASKRKVYWYSEMSDELVCSLLLHPVTDPQQTLDEALAELPEDASVALMPLGTATVPMMPEKIT